LLDSRQREQAVAVPVPVSIALRSFRPVRDRRKGEVITMARVPSSSLLSRRRLLQLGITAAGVAPALSLLAACGQAPASPATGDKAGAGAATSAPKAAAPAAKGGAVTISFTSQGNPQELKMFEDMLKGFEDKNPNIKVERKFDPSLTWEKVHVMLGAGTAASVQRANDDDIFLLRAQKVITGLDDYVKADLNRDDYYPSTWTSRVGAGGEIAAITNGSSPLIIYYNKAHFKEAGLTPAEDWDKPWTFDQFNDALAKLSKKSGDKVERYSYATVTWFPQPLMDNNGAERYNADETECTLMATPAALEILTWFQETFTTHEYGAPIDEDADKFFNSGLVSMVIDQTSFARTIQSDIDYDVMPIFLGKQKNLTENSERCFVIPSNEPNKDQAWALGKYMWGEETAMLYAKNDYAVPMLKKVTESDAFTKADRPPQNRKIYGQGVANDVLTHNNPVGDDFQKWFSRTVNELTTGQKDAKTFLQERVDRLNEALKTTGWSRKTGWVTGWTPGANVPQLVKPTTAPSK
jgi:multiple sugar transport system substrate-binding protein